MLWHLVSQIMTRNDGVWKPDAKKQEEAGENRLLGGSFVTGIPHQIIIIIIFFSARYPALAPYLQVSRLVMFCVERLLAPRPTSKLKDQVSVFMTPGDRVTQLQAYPEALGTSGAPLSVLTKIVSPWGASYTIRVIKSKRIR